MSSRNQIGTTKRAGGGCLIGESRCSIVENPAGAVSVNDVGVIVWGSVMSFGLFSVEGVGATEALKIDIACLETTATEKAFLSLNHESLLEARPHNEDTQER